MAPNKKDEVEVDIDKLPPDEFVARSYQRDILDIATEQNTIIFLPTGSGKTYIAVMLINRMAKDIILPNKKVTFILVNTVPLIEQHSLTLKRHTDFTVGHFSGDMNVDFWTRDQWSEQLGKYQVIVLTAQIFLDIIRHDFFSLDRCNLLIFDECHQGVNDSPMRQIMQTFENIQDRGKLPRVLGLTATLLNGNCSANKVIEEVVTLETTFHSKVATVHNLSDVMGYSTNPREEIVHYHEAEGAITLGKCNEKLEHLLDFINEVNFNDNNSPKHEPKKLLINPKDKITKQLKRIITSLLLHIRMLGMYGGFKATLAYMIQIERIKNRADSDMIGLVYQAVNTELTAIRRMLEDVMSCFGIVAQIYKFSSPKVIQMLEILREYKEKKDLCGIIFVQQRFTSKALYYIINDLAENDPDFSFIKCNFMFGYNAGSAERDTRETFYAAKQNKKIVNSFKNGEINLLVASNVVEEGIDIPKCTLVMKFDRPLDYRSYIQSKGRARHNTGRYLIMVPTEEKQKFAEKYSMFKQVEKLLQEYLTGRNAERSMPSAAEIQRNLYDDHDVPPYYANGPNSASVTSVGAISLLNRYCQQLLRDRYTQLAPDWYLDEETVDGSTKYIVSISLPTCCPIRQEIKGLPMSSKHAAKRSAALEVIKRLHQAGELTDKLLPRSDEESEVNFDHFFTHWKAETESQPEPRPGSSDMVDGEEVEIVNPAKPGTKKYLREYDIVTPPFIIPEDNFTNTYYVYPIHMPHTDLNHYMSDIHNEIISSEMGYALVTKNVLPPINEFPIFLSVGEVKVTFGQFIKVELNENELNAIIKFNHFIFNDVLRVMKDFVTIDCDMEAGFMLIAPIMKCNANLFYVAMDIVAQYTKLEVIDEPSDQVKINLQVTNETHLKKIVCPWYRRNDSIYLVIRICDELSALSPFPSNDYESYQQYYRDRYSQQICSPHLPLLLAKGIKKKMNCILPRSATLHGSNKRNKDMQRENFEEHLVPELCVLQKYPGELWYLAYCLPTIIHRVTMLMRAEHLRRIIAKQTGLGLAERADAIPLVVDPRILKPEPKKVEPLQERNTTATNQLALPSPTETTETQTPKLTNKDYQEKMLEKEYSWTDDQEPMDIDRCIDQIELQDIAYYEKFVSEKYKYDEAKKRLSPAKNSRYPAITLPLQYEPKQIDMLNQKGNLYLPDQTIIFQCLTSTKANEIVNLERLETLGDSFLKFITTLYLFLDYPAESEGRLTHIKGKIIGNRNLLYCALQKNLGGFMNISEFAPATDWIPPCFAVPKFIRNLIETQMLNVCSLFTIGLPEAEQLSGQLSEATQAEILEICEELQKEEDLTKETVSGMNRFLRKQTIPDKTVSDCVEALIGAYLLTQGVHGALGIVRWFNILPVTKTEIDLNGIFSIQPTNPLIDPFKTEADVDKHIPNYAKLEEALGYKFNNRAYLLQALTHASFSLNRITDCYQRLEFLGDAILDFLITCHIYEISDNLMPGQLTDLRSALVNNVTFACLVVRNGFQKHLKYINTRLMEAIDCFVKYQELRNHAVNDEALTLIEEHSKYSAEHVHVPKVLGDLFESLAGAVFLDTGMDLQKTWEVFHALMWNEIEMFRRDVPKNPVRLLYENVYAAPHFEVEATEAGVTCVNCSFMIKGKKYWVSGFGENKLQAKRAASKLALKLLKS